MDADPALDLIERPGAMPAIRRRPSQTIVSTAEPSYELGLQGGHAAARAQRHRAQRAAQPDPLAVGGVGDRSASPVSA